MEDDPEKIKVVEEIGDIKTWLKCVRIAMKDLS